MQDETKPEEAAPKDAMAELEEGYKTFREWAEAMARAGQPLPPGGTCLLTRRAVFIARLLDLRATIAGELRLPIEAIKVELDTHPLTRHLVPKIDIDFPEGYLAVAPQLVDPAGKPPEELAREHARGVIAEFYKRFVADVNGRLDAMARSYRPDLEIEVEDLLAKGTDSGGHTDPPHADGG